VAKIIQKRKKTRKKRKKKTKKKEKKKRKEKEVKRSLTFNSSNVVKRTTTSASAPSCLTLFKNLGNL
jgi:hypothetical protein